MHQIIHAIAILGIIIAFALAHPQGLSGHPDFDDSSGGGSDGPDRGNDDANENTAPPMLVVNTDLVPLTIHEDFGTMRLWYPDGIERVRIDDAPPGYGCFFWSRSRLEFTSGPAGDEASSVSSSSPSSSSSFFSLKHSSSAIPGTSLLHDKFVSETFYSSSSSSLHKFTKFDPPIAPDYLTCFTVPEPMDPDSSVAVWIESYSLPAPKSSSALAKGDSEGSRVPKRTLMHIPFSSPIANGRLGGKLFPQMIELRRAALVHVPKHNARCVPILRRTDGLDEDKVAITEDKPLLSPISDAIGLKCSAEN